MEQWQPAHCYGPSALCRGRTRPFSLLSWCRKAKVCNSGSLHITTVPVHSAEEGHAPFLCCFQYYGLRLLCSFSQITKLVFIDGFRTEGMYVCTCTIHVFADHLHLITCTGGCTEYTIKDETKVSIIIRLSTFTNRTTLP